MEATCLKPNFDHDPMHLFALSHNKKLRKQTTSKPSAYMAASSSQRSRYLCVICHDTFETSEDGPPTIANDFACPECIKALFEHSILNESNWPASWGRQVLDPWPFRRILGNDFLRRFREVEAEYSCPGTERVYCNDTNSSAVDPDVCGNFLGRREDAETERRCRRCNKCNAATCLRCLKTFSPFSDQDSLRMATRSGSEVRIHHHCDPSISRRLRDQAFEGLRRGRHYQDCPRCRRRIELSDGCNHITCRCGENFCYICARVVTEHSDHWDRRRGGCPRYGRPGSRNAIFTDDMDGFDDADDDAQGIESGSDSDSDYIPSEHGEMPLEEDWARWEIQNLFEQQARREQRRNRLAMQRAARGRAHIQDLGRERDVMARIAMGLTENERAAPRRQLVVERLRAEDETSSATWPAGQGDPTTQRLFEEIRDDVAHLRNQFHEMDTDVQALPGARQRPRERPRVGDVGSHGIQHVHRLHDEADRDQRLMIDDLDHRRGRGRIFHPRPEERRRYRAESPPQSLPLGSRSLGDDGRMYELIAMERALSEGPGEGPSNPGRGQITGRSRLHHTDLGDPRSGSAYHDGWPRPMRGDQSDEESNDDWDYYSQRSRQFEQQRRAPRRREQELRDMAAAVDEGRTAQRRRAAGNAQATECSEHDAAPSRNVRSSENRRTASRSGSRLASLPPRGGWNQASQARRSWRDIPRRLWRYSQAVGGAILNSPPRPGYPR